MNRNRFMPGPKARRGGSPLAHCFGLRTMSGVLLASLLLPLFVPFFSLGSETTMPACCRRDGKHHCAMSARLQEPVQGTASGPIASAATPDCPYRSRLLTAFVFRVLFMPRVAVFYGQAASYPAPSLEAISFARRGEFRSNLQRGPPLLSC